MPDQRRVVLVTGASSGIGRATAHRLAARGDRLVLSARSAETLEAVAEECRVAGATAADVATVVADVGDSAAVRELFRQALARFGRVDAVVHAASVLAYGEFTEIPAEVFDGAVTTNVTGLTNVARQALDRFRHQGGGRLVVIGSVLGHMAAPTMSPYVTSKWAVHGFVRTLQVELRREPGIDVSLISPAGVDTPIYRQAGTYMGRHGSPPPPVDSPEKLASVVETVLDHPSREVALGRLMRVVAVLFHVAPAVFDAVIGPLFRALATGSARDLPPTAGNVLSPRPEGEAVHGGYGRWGTEPPESKGTPMRIGNQLSAEHGDEPGPTVSKTIEAPVEAVWTVLADGWSYATWVVGTSRIRRVEDTWPAAGSRVYHSFGLWPLVIDDFTRVEEVERPDELVLRARGWPMGEARVHLSVRPDGSDRCVVAITEDAVSGPARLIPPPVRRLMLIPRNRETLRRLALLAEGRHRGSQG